MPVLKQCCCCCSVRVGSFVIGIYVMVVNIIGLVLSAYLVANPGELTRRVRKELGCPYDVTHHPTTTLSPSLLVGDDVTHHPTTTLSPSLLVGDDVINQQYSCEQDFVRDSIKTSKYIAIGDMTLNLVMITLCVTMMVGVHLRKAFLMFPFISFLVLILILAIILVLYILITLHLTGAAGYVLVLGLFGTTFVLHVYMTLCLISHFQELREEAKRTRSHNNIELNESRYCEVSKTDYSSPPLYGK